MFAGNSSVSYMVPSASGIGAVASPLGVGAGSLPAVFWSQPAGGTTITAIGGALNGAGGGTTSTAITTSGTTVNRFRRTLVTSSAAAGNGAALLTSYTRWYRGTNGGFEAQIVFATESNATGHGAFVGFSTLTAAMTTADPTTLTDCVGIGYTAAEANTGTWSLIHNDSSGVATQTGIPGMTRSTTDGYVLKISCPKGAAASVTVSITNLVTGAVILTPTVLSSNLPTANTALAVGIHAYNGAIASSVIVSSPSIYITCDY